MFSMIGCAILTMLHELDRAGELQQDSKFKDLGLVMCMALEWTDGQEDYGTDEGDLNWRNTIVAYARKAGIDLQSVPIFNAQELVDGVDDDLADDVSGQSKADRFDWRKNVSRALRCNPSIDRDRSNPHSSSRNMKLRMVRRRGRMGSRA